MGGVPVHYVDLRAFCYATEDESRVVRALRTYLPDDVDLDRVVTTGHHGDRIVVLSARVERADGVRHVLDRVRELDDLDAVLDELDDRVDEDCSFHLSLDKQAALDGAVRRGDGIRLRAKVEAYPARRAAAIDAIRGVLTAS